MENKFYSLYQLDLSNKSWIIISERAKRVTITSEGDYFFIEIGGFTYCTKGIKAAFALLKAVRGVAK